MPVKIHYAEQNSFSNLSYPNLKLSTLKSGFLPYFKKNYCSFHLSNKSKQSNGYTTALNTKTLIAFLYLVTPFSWLVNKPSLKSVHRNQLCRNEMIIQNCVGCELYTRKFYSQRQKIPKFHLFSKHSLDLCFSPDTLFLCFNAWKKLLKNQSIP